MGSEAPGAGWCDQAMCYLAHPVWGKYGHRESLAETGCAMFHVITSSAKVYSAKLATSRPCQLWHDIESREDGKQGSHTALRVTRCSSVDIEITSTFVTEFLLGPSEPRQTRIGIHRSQERLSQYQASLTLTRIGRRRAVMMSNLCLIMLTCPLV